MDLLRSIFKGDKVIWIIFLFLCLISIVEVFSAASTLTYKSGDHWGPITQHSIILMVGAVVVVFMHNIPYKLFQVFPVFLLPLSVVLLGLVMMMERINGAARWMTFMGIQFQPSEVAKMAVLAGYLLVGAALPVWSAKRGQAVAREYRQALADTNSYVLESLRGLRDTLQYQDTAARAAGITAHSETLGAKQTALKYREGLIVAVTNTLILFTTLAVLGVSLWLYQRGELAAQGVLVCTLTALSSFGPVVALANLGAGLTQVFASADRVLALLDEEPVTPEVTDGENTPFAGAEVRGVSFGYAGEQVLREISLTIPEKKIVGITGRSGSGKSTLLRLLMRFWDVQTGSIRFGAEDIRRVNTAALRAQESLVTQETELFADTIGNNIRIAKHDAAQEEVEAACKKAALDDFIRSLPKGYDTPVGELGGTLSGGERQRIGVARAFLHDAPFLLLDEPTSNLDSLNEGIILRAVRAECKDRTVLLVSHRKSTMAAADVSFSVESGRVS